MFVRHPLKSLLIGTGVLAGLAVAAMGIFVLLALLIVGAAVAFVYRLIRHSVQGTTATGDDGVIEGEFQVIKPDPKDYPRQLGLDGPARG